MFCFVLCGTGRARDPTRPTRHNVLCGAGRVGHGKDNRDRSGRKRARDKREFRDRSSEDRSMHSGKKGKSALKVHASYFEFQLRLEFGIV